MRGEGWVHIQVLWCPQGGRVSRGWGGEGRKRKGQRGGICKQSAIGLGGGGGGSSVTVFYKRGK
jgi:hypothetical protein